MIFFNKNKSKNKKKETELINGLPWGWLTENVEFTSKRDNEFANLFITARTNCNSFEDEIEKLQKAINYYYKYKQECLNKGKYFYQYFENQHMHINSSETNPNGIEEVEILKERLNYINLHKDETIDFYRQKEKNYKKYLKYKDPNEDNIKRFKKNDFSYNYINVNQKSSEYSNSTNTYVSTAGKKCIEYENKILNRAKNYKNSTCPYCNKAISLPKRSKKCEFCNNKIYLAKGKIKQGQILLTEEENHKLYELRDIFYNDKNYNPNYENGVYIIE